MISFRPGWRSAVESYHGRRRTPLEALTSLDMQLLTIFLLTVAATASANRGFIFTAPKRLLVNSTELLCLSLHNVSGTAHVNVDVLYPDSDEKITSAQTRMKHGLGGCMEMYVPPTMQLRGRLHLKVSFDEHYDYNINSVKEVYIQPDPFITFIETDKPVYKPGEEVLFRILTIKHNLQAVINPISRVWIESPAQIRLAQWVQVETQQGLVQLRFQLSHEPPQGMWEIKVQHSETRISRQLFEVREYVLPKFDVTVIPPDYILADAESLAWNICAKYSFGQPVKGKLFVRAISQFPRWRPIKVQIPEIEYTTELNSTDGCATFNISGKELGLQKWDISPNLITVIANVTEAGTSNTRNAESSSTVLHQALKLEFVSHNSRYFKPGLPYKGKLKVLHQNNVPVMDEIIQLCLKVRGKGEWSQTLVVCRNFTSNENGFVNFLVPPQHHNVVLLSFVATAVNYQTNYYSPDVKWRVFMNQPAAVFDVYSWYSPSESYLEIIDSNDESLQCGSRYQIEVYYTTRQDVTNITFYYMIQSKGDVIMLNYAEWHAQHENINFEQRFSNILSNGEEENRNNVAANALNKDGKQEIANQRKIGVFPINLKISPQLSPESYLLVYYVRDDGEVVATNHILKIHNCFANKVQTSFPEGSHIPGSDVWIEISAAPKSLCTLSAVDKSTSFLGKVHRIDKKRVFQDISRFHIDLSSGPRQSDPWEYCTKKSRATNSTANGADGSNWNLGWPVEPPFWDLKRRRRSIATQPFSKYVDSIQAFDDFGAVVMSDLMLETRPCNAMTGGLGDPNLLMNVMPLLARSAGVHRDSLPAHGLMASSPLAYPLTVSAAMPPGAIYADEHRQSHTEVRSFFPETWLWELVHIGDNGKIQLKKELPHTVTDWVGNTICISPELGLGISPTTHITAFQPFFLELTFPYSIKRGEIILLKTSLFNFLSHSLPVQITFEESFGIELLDNNTVTICVKERESTVHSFRIQALDLGDLNITISAEVDPFYPQECGPENIVNRRDVIVKPVKVVPEGFPMEIIKSQLLCSTNDSDYMEVFWNLQLPPNIIEDSARADLSIVGDLLGPALQNLDNLVKVPMGCGEQNMILFVPNLHVINYMNATHQENPVLHAQALKNMEKGYQRELNYRHTDGSYSAFGNSDAEGSMWLTAFVLKSFAQARKHIFIDENDLIVSMNWIIQKQLENGCFPLIGSVFHKELKGGMPGETTSSALSAFVLISLIETQLPITSSVISNALYCLQADSNPDLYTLALKTYALALVGNRELAESSLQQFLGKASQQQDLLWWEIPGASLSLNIEMTAYGILALVKQGGEVNLIHALQAIRWISRHRNTKGGFISTQDTVVALEALAKYARTLPQNDESGFDVTARVIELEKTFHIPQERRLLQHQLSLPVLPTPVEITVKGTGCVLAQVSLRYNMINPQGSDAFELEVISRAIAAVDKCTMQKIEACIRTKHIEQTTNMAVLEVFMVTGYVPDRASLYQLSRHADTTLKRWEEERDKVNFYFEELNHRKQCIVFHIVQETEVENPAEATVKLYDYYQQELTIQKTYNIDETCKIERLPYPVPDVHGLEEEENYASNFTVMQADTSNTTENASVEGLNPLFVNVDHELEVPSGEEGPVPSYAQPQADRDFTEEVSCPSCETSAPSNFSQMYCNSAKVFKLIMRKTKTARLLMDLSGSRSPRRMRKLVQFLLHRDCRCPSLERTGGQVILLLDRDIVTVQSEEDKISTETDKERNSRFHQMALNSSAVLINIESQPGQPEIIKIARSTC